VSNILVPQEADFLRRMVSRLCSKAGAKRAPDPMVDGPISDLRSLVDAFLQDGALKYEMQPTILLSGSMGVGKCNSARLVAEDLGLHFSEVRFESSVILF
jgi:MoxR-like ATPase